MFTFIKIWYYSYIWSRSARELIEKLYRHGSKEDFAILEKELADTRNAIERLEALKSRTKYLIKWICSHVIATTDSVYTEFLDVKDFLEDTLNG